MLKKMFYAIALLTLFLGANLPLAAGIAVAETELTREAKIVQQGRYDVIIVPESMQLAFGDQILSLLEREYGDQVLKWTVQEEDALNYVYAYPFEAASRDVSEPGRRTEATRNSFDALVSTQSLSYCLRLHDKTWWQGAYMSVCGSPGEVKQYERLDYYGWDNKFESYYEENTSGAVSLHDGWYFGGWRLDVTSDLSSFGSSYNNQASSMKAYF